MRSLKPMVLVVLLVAGSTAQADGRIRNAVANWQEARQERREMRSGCGCQSAPAQPQPAPAAQPTPTVVATSYSGIGVPVDATPYQPIQVGQPLPTSCGPGGCGQRQFAPQVFSPPVFGGGWFRPTTCGPNGCGR